MLKEVFAVNFFDLRHSVSNDNALEIFMYLFPYHLKQALRQGLFKQYQTCEYNNSNVRGVIDIPKHIRKNIPFGGNVAYKTREFTYDNKITQLIRHTIEFIKKQPIGKSILKEKDIEDCITTIVDATPSYSSSKLLYVINKNLKPLQHPYYTKYRKLQQLCLQILHRKGLKYGEGQNKVFGLLFSGSWLWEEYLGHLLQKYYKHYYKNKGKKFNLFDSPYYQQIVPDYVQLNSDGLTPIAVADAKYIRLDKGSSYAEEKATAIYYKTITYMYHLGVSTGFLFYPSSTVGVADKMKLRNTNSYIIKLPLLIPDGDMSFADFCNLMKKSEMEFVKNAIINNTI